LHPLQLTPAQVVIRSIRSTGICRRTGFRP
jgi:hypothetical protein